MAHFSLPVKMGGTVEVFRSLTFCTLYYVVDKM